MLKGYAFPKCSLDSQSLPDRDCEMKEKGLKQPGALRSLNIVLCGWSVEYRDILLQDMRREKKTRTVSRSLS